MKKTSLLLFAALLACSAMAQQLDPEQALSAALDGIRSGSAAPQRVRARDTYQLAHTRTRDGQTLFYVFEQPTGGFLIAGADGRTNALLGYTDSGSWADMQSHPAFAEWLEGCADAIAWAVDHLGENGGTSRIAATGGSVAPLLGDIRWDQNAPYSTYCPERPNAEGVMEIAPTGCVATAMAQVMAYHQWPTSGTGSHTNAHDSTQTVDFSQSTYDWSLIRPRYRTDAAGDTAMAVARLMADVGCALDMTYQAGGSYTSSTLIVSVLADYFRYDRGISCAKRNYYTTAEWNALLMSELDERRPICFRAQTSLNEGHAFVIDGYDTNGLYHVNWGWDGMSNGYFDINFLNPDMQGTGGGDGSYYNVGQGAMIGIRPDRSGTSQGTVRLLMDTPIDYDDTTGEFTYIITNAGTGIFTGQAGFLLTDSTGAVVDSVIDSYTDTPLGYGEEVTEYCTLPEGFSTAGCRLTPVYRLAEGGPLLTFDTRLTENRCLISEQRNGEIVWTYAFDELADLTGSVVVTRSFAGFSPRFEVSVQNGPGRPEYNGRIYATIFRRNVEGYDTYCSGISACYLQPGEETTLAIDCQLLAGGHSYADLEPGDDYICQVSYELGSRAYLIVNKTFSMTPTAPADLSYGTPALERTEIHVGDSLRGTLRVTNNGGYTARHYLLCVFPSGTGYNLAAFGGKEVELQEGSSVELSLGGVPELAPGTYRALFLDNDAHAVVPDHTPMYFTILGDDGSAVEQTEAKPAAGKVLEDGQVVIIRDGVVYDVMGRKR